jgi:hypothetical protein
LGRQRIPDADSGINFAVQTMLARHRTVDAAVMPAGSKFEKEYEDA